MFSIYYCSEFFPFFLLSRFALAREGLVRKTEVGCYWVKGKLVTCDSWYQSQLVRVVGL